MQRILTLAFVVAVLPATFVVVGRAQGGGTSPVSTVRAANAPSLVPVRLNSDGNFRIAPPYVTDPAFTAKPDVPQGRVIRFTMNSAESKIFPTAPVGRGGRAGGARGEPAPQTPAEPPQHQTFQRQVAVYVPAGYVPNTPVPFIVVQDGQSYVPGDPPAAADGQPRPFMPVMLDNLIHEKRIPPIVAVLIPPGPGGQRTIEYDTVSDRYTNFVESEVLPRITREYQVAFTTDPEGRAAFGVSSGAAALRIRRSSC